MQIKIHQHCPSATVKPGWEYLLKNDLKTAVREFPAHHIFRIRHHHRLGGEYPRKKRLFDIVSVRLFSSD